MPGAGNSSHAGGGKLITHTVAGNLSHNGGRGLVTRTGEIWHRGLDGVEVFDDVVYGFAKVCVFGKRLLYVRIGYRHGGVVSVKLLAYVGKRHSLYLTDDVYGNLPRKGYLSVSVCGL